MSDLIRCEQEFAQRQNPKRFRAMEKTNDLKETNEVFPALLARVMCDLFPIDGRNY